MARRRSVGPWGSSSVSVGLGIWPFIIYAFRKKSWKVYPDESHEHSEEGAGVADAEPDAKTAN